MELTFDKATGICEFEVTADFNLHIERPDGGTLHIYQRTAGGEYDYVNKQGYLSGEKVIDMDFTALVYPKTIKIKSSVIPTLAVVTFAATSGDTEEEVVEDDIFYFYDGTGWGTTCNIITQEMSAEGDVIFNPDNPLECATKYGRRGNSMSFEIYPGGDAVVTLYDYSGIVLSTHELSDVAEDGFSGMSNSSSYPTYIIVENKTTGRTYKVWMAADNVPW